VEWFPINEAPTDGTMVLLWLDRGYPALGRWFEPWGVWLRDSDLAPLDDEIGEIEIYGIGRDVPTHFAYVDPPGYGQKPQSTGLTWSEERRVARTLAI
jgi:hypothetical protein